MTNEPYSTKGMRSYSDGFDFFPSCPAISNIQVCWDCMNPFIIDSAEVRYADSPEDYENGEISTGRLPYEEVKVLTLPFLPLPDNKPFEFFLRKEFLISYNHAFRGLDADAFADFETDDDFVRSDEDVELHHKNLAAMAEIMENPDFPDDEDKTLFLAEIYRELGNFERTIELLKNFTSENTFLTRNAEQIRRKAVEKESRVFEIDRTGEKIMVVF